MTGYTRMPYSNRPFTHPLAKEIAQLMDKKESNICLAADVKSMVELIKLADQVGKEIILLKTHVDTYSDFNSQNLEQLKELAKKHQFIIFEDRKFLDIGSVVEMQYGGGIFKIAEWAPLTNATIASGPDILNALKKVIREKASSVTHVANNAVLLLAEMSSQGNAFSTFLEKTVEVASQHRDLVIGYIAQRSFGDPAFLYMTPGVNAIQKGDNLGQQFRTPEDVIKDGSDVLIIGRGIYEAKDPLEAAQKYKEAGWKAHQLALNTKLQ